MGMATTHSRITDYEFRMMLSGVWVSVPIFDSEPLVISDKEIGNDNAQAPSFYINKNIQTIAPHKKQRRNKFKRR